ncbi:protein furry [Diaphorina citri]|uniref:Protein furry n=1 Tax=Diaphorina citri TaxID=121845 RepID=A0A3Q0J393_DIACI|nr:protein furry [Diaphorina citri]
MQCCKLQLGLSTPPTHVTQHNFTDPDPEFDRYLSSSSDHIVSTPTPNKPDPPPLIVVPEDEVTQPKSIALNPDVKNLDIQHVITSLVEFLSSKHNQVLWPYEDITAKVWTIRSGEQLDIFLRHVLRLFRESLPHALISERWAQTALQLGLSCGSRHYAGRSLQIFRALRVPINSRMLTDILSRLVETVAETGEDMQGYVTELLLTLESAVDALESDFRPLDHMKELFKSTPNLNNKEAGGAGASGKSCGCTSPNTYEAVVPLLSQFTPLLELPVVDATQSIAFPMNVIALLPYMLLHYALASSPGLNVPGGMMGLCSHMSGVHARSTSYSISYCTRKAANCAANMDSKAAELRARGVGISPGDLEARCGGTASPSAKYSPSLVLEKGPSQMQLPVLNIIHCMLHYVDLNSSSHFNAELLRVIAKHIEGVNYKEALNILKLVVTRSSTLVTPPQLHHQYINWESHSTSSHSSFSEFKKELPGRTMEFTIDLSQTPVIGRKSVKPATHFRCVNYKEALNILKLVVTRSSTLVTPPQLHHQYINWESHSTSSHSSFSEFKKELPGKRLPCSSRNISIGIVYTGDISELTPCNTSPNLAFRPILREDTEELFRLHIQSLLQQTPPSSLHLFHTLHRLIKNGINITGWKRPWMSQSRVRECLVNVLTTCGQRVGLPKSPSDDVFLSFYNKVIFSQSSDLLERQSSMASSTEEVSGPDISGGTGSRPPHRDPADHFGVFKDFDFLEYESESVEGESTDNFNWGVRRRPLSEGDENPEPRSLLEESLSEKTPLLTMRKLGAGVIEESSDDEIGSESPLDEIPPVPEFSSASSVHHHHQPSTLSIRPRTMSDPRSDTSFSCFSQKSFAEPIVEVGRSLYKLYFQLMLLLESANKMIALVVNTARSSQNTWDGHRPIALNEEIEAYRACQAGGKLEFSKP